MFKKSFGVLSIFLLAFIFNSCKKNSDPQPEEIPDVKAAFTSDTQEVFEGEQVSFQNESTGDPTEFRWTFDGGIPGTSNDKNPVVTYNDEGSYDVKLVASNTSKSDSIIKSNYINVISILEKGLLAHYKLDGNTQDATGNTPDGVISGTVNYTSDRFGMTKSAYLFSQPDQRIDISANFNVDNVFSIFCWVKITSAVTTQSHHVINLDGTIGFLIRSPEGLRIVLDDPMGNRVDSQTNSPDLFNDNEWHHVGFTFDGMSLKVYIDGVFVSGSIQQTEFKSIQGIISLGNHNTVERPLFGAIDDVRFYNRVLPENEILRLSSDK